jgi:tRNA(fMet)-specific endonuclease VapC
VSTSPPGSLPWRLVDTSVAADVLRREPQIRQRFQQISPVVPVIVIGELLYGAERAQRRELQLQRIMVLVAGSRVVDCTSETATHYASIRRRLELQGTPIPENDIWIAAAAAQHQLPIATRDAHFRHLSWMQVELW